MDATNYKSLEQYNYCKRLYHKRIKTIIILSLIWVIWPIPFIVFIHPGFGFLYAMHVITPLFYIWLDDHCYLSDYGLIDKWESKQAYEKLLDKAIQGD